MLGTNPLLWCCPNVGPLGTGLKYQLAESEGIELQQAWPPSDPTEKYGKWTQPDSPWTYDNDGPNPALKPSNSQLRSRKRGRRGGSDDGGVSAVPPYHPDYEPAQDWQDDGDSDGVYYHRDNNDDDDDKGERFAEYEHQQRTAHVRRGSEGYEVQAIDREQLLAEYIASRGQEEGYYRRYVPDPSSETESESGGEDAPEGIGAEAEDDEDENQDDNEPLAVRVEKWRSGEAIS